MRLPTKQPVKLPTRLHPVWGEHIQRRDFLTLSGTTDYVRSDNLISFALPATISFNFSTSKDFAGLISLITDNSDEYIHLSVADGFIKPYTAGFTPGGGSTPLNDGKLHSVLVGIDESGLFSVYVDGVIEAQIQHTNTDKIASSYKVLIGCRSNYEGHYPYSMQEGVLSDIKISCDSGLVSHWPINTAGDTILDVVGGNHGTLINGSSSDWERFEKAPSWDYWLGEELWVPALASALNPSNSNAQSTWDPATNSGRIKTGGDYTDIRIVDVRVPGRSYKMSVVVTDIATAPAAGEGLRFDDNDSVVLIPAPGGYSAIRTAGNPHLFLKRSAGAMDIGISSPSCRRYLEEAV